MALFAADDDAIKARLRLSSVPVSSEDTLAIIDEAILATRLEFYRRLGRSRVTQLVALTEVAEPATDDQIRRSVATRCEIRMVRVRVLRDLPSAFMDASGDLHRRWNEEAPFRERPRSDLEREIARLLEEIEQDMQLLSGAEESPGAERNVLIYDGTPEEEPPLPGDTLIPYTRRIAAED